MNSEGASVRAARAGPGAAEFGVGTLFLLSASASVWLFLKNQPFDTTTTEQLVTLLGTMVTATVTGGTALLSSANKRREEVRLLDTEARLALESARTTITGLNNSPRNMGDRVTNGALCLNLAQTGQVKLATALLYDLYPHYVNQDSVMLVVDLALQSSDHGTQALAYTLLESAEYKVFSDDGLEHYWPDSLDGQWLTHLDLRLRLGILAGYTGAVEGALRALETAKLTASTCKQAELLAAQTKVARRLLVTLLAAVEAERFGVCHSAATRLLCEVLPYVDLHRKRTRTLNAFPRTFRLTAAFVAQAESVTSLKPLLPNQGSNIVTSPLFEIEEAAKKLRDALSGTGICI